MIIVFRPWVALIAVAMLSLAAVSCEVDPRLVESDRPVTVEAPAGTYTHAGSGFEFPAGVGVLERGEVVAYDESGDDVGVEYRGRVTPVIADVYVYPADESARAGAPPSREHFDGVKSALVHENDGAVQVGEDATLTLAHRPDAAGWKATYRIAREAAGQDQTVLSEAYLFIFDDWYVKYRFTYPEAASNSVQYSISEFLDELEWPEDR